MRFVLATVQLVAALGAVIALGLSLFAGFELTEVGMGLLGIYALIEAGDRWMKMRTSASEKHPTQNP
ncbi:hypothetical protein J2S49_000710 [Arcanobacterium wilhelmae]|uniref:Uncharacterized protein n=1 Tax=Arcanobacterium wilhelmae TaxID=1803177 RepID=A0ABT9NA99_9ACTO|nr:hypothetical protein [Arcanobacterium wilhelmae]MDP9800634.1 hypothetical protein [Arcanobacterium wilhelmae]WFN90041.1 hypothetical protein P8A24_07555 [Arcanobacterium wilhelmae]